MAFLHHFDGGDCVAENFATTDTFYLGCDPTVKLTDFNNQETVYSANLQCIINGNTTQSDRRLSALTLEDISESGIIPSNGKIYAVQELVFRCL